MIRFVLGFCFVVGLILTSSQSSRAQEWLCDPSFQDCYSPLLRAVQNETAGIDIALYWIELPELADAIINRYQVGVPVRIVVEPRASTSFSQNQTILDRFKAAGIPMRYKLGEGIIHAKMLLLAGQNKVVFSGSNFGDADVRPYSPYANYVDGAWYFSDDSAVVSSFKTRYDDIWTDTVTYGNYANITGSLIRKYETHAIAPSMNFLPNSDASQDYGARTIALIDKENRKIDLTMYRITELSTCDALLRAVARGVQVRLLAEPNEYRFDASRTGAELTGPYNVDRLYAAGVQVRMRKHLGLTHQKSVSLYQQNLTIFGSSNWSLPSFNYQEEHNYFTNKAWFFKWFVDQFERKWNSPIEYEPFVPQPPDVPVNLSPVDGVSSVGQSQLLTWEGGRWAHKYDVYLGLDHDNLSLIATDLITGTLGTQGSETYPLSNLLSGVTYCWRIVGKTMANQTAAGPTSCFTTSGTAATETTSSSMQLLIDLAGPAIDQLASLDSVLLLRDPFPVLNGMGLLGLGGAQKTKLIVFVKGLQLAEGEPAYTVVISLRDANNQSYNVLAESVRPVPNADFFQVTFGIPNNLVAGPCTVKIKAHGQITNAGTVRIGL